MEKRKFEKIVNRCFFYNIDVFLIYILISATLLRKLMIFHPDIERSLYVLIANALLLIAAYTLNKVSDRKEDDLNEIVRAEMNQRNIYILFVILIVISLALYLVNLPLQFLPGVAILILLSYRYSRLGKFRLKRFFLIKNLVPAFCWYLSLVLMIEAGLVGLDSLQIPKLLLPLFFLFFLFEIIWDMPDIYGDKIAGIKTMPAIMGFEKTKFLLLMGVVVAFLLNPSLPDKLITILLFIFILFVSEQTKKFTYHYFLLFLTVILTSLNIS